MKRPTSYLRHRLIRLATKRAKRRTRLQRRKRRRYGRSFPLVRDKINAPRSFSLLRKGGADEVTRFIRAISHAVLTLKRDIRIDFRGTEIFYPEATILMYAEVDRIISMAERSKPIAIIDPIRRRPREVLKQIGLHELTGDRCDIVPQRDDVVYWKSSKGKDQTGDDLKMIEVVAERVREEHSGDISLAATWRGVSEAVANTVDHAYSLPRADGFAGLKETRWWMFTQVRDSVFSVAICDLGCGYRSTIGLTIPEQFLSEVARLFAGVNRDVFAIQAALEYGRSGTRQQQRGKGSRDAMSVLEKHGAGELFILSNTGYVRLDKEFNESPTRKSGSVGVSIQGTIVWWRLPIAETSHGDN